jgi:hypothetical protein
MDLFFKNPLRITRLLSVDRADMGPLLLHRGASQERRVGSDPGYNPGAKPRCSVKPFLRYIDSPA